MFNVTEHPVLLEGVVILLQVPNSNKVPAIMNK